MRRHFLGFFLGAAIGFSLSSIAAYAGHGASPAKHTAQEIDLA